MMLVEASHRTYHCRGELTQETTEPALTVVENDIADAMGNLADADTAERGRHQVVDGRRFLFAAHLPHQTASQCIRCRFPEGETVAAGGIVIKIAVIGMGEKIGGELVVVPNKTILRL